MRAIAIAVVAFLAGAGGGIVCSLYLATGVHNRVMAEYEDTLGWKRELLNDSLHAVNGHYLPLQSIQRGDFAALTQWHCYALGIKLQGLRPGLVDDPEQSERAERLRVDALSLLEELERNGTCLAPGGADMGRAEGDG